MSWGDQGGDVNVAEYSLSRAVSLAEADKHFTESDQEIFIIRRQTEIKPIKDKL